MYQFLFDILHIFSMLANFQIQELNATSSNYTQKPVPFNCTGMSFFDCEKTKGVYVSRVKENLEKAIENGFQLMELSREQCRAHYLSYNACEDYNQKIRDKSNQQIRVKTKCDPAKKKCYEVETKEESYCNIL